MLTVADMMTPNPHALPLTKRYLDAQVLMEQADIRHIPLLDSAGRVCGIVSQRDLLAAKSSFLDPQATASEEILKTPLENMATKSFMSVSKDASLKQAAIYMQDHKIGCLPVVEQGSLIGIITDSDFVAIAINLLEMQEESEPLTYDD